MAVAGDFLVLGGMRGTRYRSWRGMQRQRLGPAAKGLAGAGGPGRRTSRRSTYGQGYLYVIGSHSFRRRRMKPELSVRKNRERLLEVQQEPAATACIALPLMGRLEGRQGGEDDLPSACADPLLGLFYGLPSKENGGIDIEGMAFRDERLYLGFRGPVLRDNYVPVMVLELPAQTL